MAWSLAATLPINRIVALYKWTDGYLYAGCSEGKIYRSNDGSSFNLVHTDSGGTYTEDYHSIWDICAFGSYLYAITWEGRILRSSNGTSWSFIENLGGNYGWSLVVHDSNFYAVCGSAPQIYRAPDGVTWTKVLELVGDHFYTGISFGDHIYTGLDATGATNGAVYRSDTGDDGDWDRVLECGTTDNIRAFGKLNGYLFVNRSGTILRSANGIDWATVATIAGTSYGAKTSGGIYVPTLYMHDQAGKIHKTTSGVDWTEDDDIDADVDVLFRMDILDSNIYLASGNSGKIFKTALTLQYDLTISSGAGGSVTVPGEGVFPYDDEDVVALTATPDAYYHFVNWSGDVGTIDDVNDPTTNITIGGDYTIVANFAIDTSKFKISCKKNDGTSTIIPSMGKVIEAGGSKSDVISMSGFANLSVNDTIELWIQNLTGTENCVVENVSLSIKRIIKVS